MKVQSFEQFILVCDEVLPVSLCDTLMRLFREDDRVQTGKVVDFAGQRTNSADKLTDELPCDPEGVWREPHEHLHRAVTEFVLTYTEQSPAFRVAPVRWTGYKIKRYPHNKGYFKWHFDALGPGANDRVLGMILYLNDVQSGGETEFYHQGSRINPVKGRGVLFPAAWTHLHCGHVPTSSEKFVITSFVSFDLSALGAGAAEERRL